METAQPQAVSKRPREVTVAGVELIVVGALTTLANGAFFLLAVSGGLEDILFDAGYELRFGLGVFTAIAGLGLVMGVVAILSGIKVLGLRPAWRVVGIVTAGLLALSAVVNLLTGIGNIGAVIILLLLNIHIVTNLGKSSDAFASRETMTMPREG